MKLKLAFKETDMISIFNNPRTKNIPWFFAHIITVDAPKFSQLLLYRQAVSESVIKQGNRNCDTL